MTISHTIQGFVSEHHKFALAFGCFDILHIGHVRFFRTIKNHTDLPLCVGILPDFVVTATKGIGRPIVCETQRTELLNALRDVDFAFILEPSERFMLLKEEYRLSDNDIPLWSTALCWLDILRPKEFYYSSDFKMTEKINRFFVDREICSFVVPYTIGISTTDILNRLNS